VLATKAFKFEAKASEVAGHFTGRASVYGVIDAYNDVVMPGAFTKTLEDHGGRIVVLSQHDPSEPIGFAELEDTKQSLNASGALVLDLQSAKDAYVRLQNGLIDGLSIGYEVVKDNFQNGVRQLHEIKLWEVSLVTFPANQFARVTDVKSEIARLLQGKDVDSQVSTALQQASRVLTAELVEALVEHKAGRVLSDTNRKKVQTAHDTLTEAVSLLKELLDLTDPNASKSAQDLLDRFHALRTSIET